MIEYTDGGSERRDNHRELTKEGIRKARARGVKIGFSNEKFSGNHKEICEKGVAVVKENANKFASKIVCLVLFLKLQGYVLAQTAELFNSKGIESARGGDWSPASVANIFKRFDIPRWHPGWDYEGKYNELLQQKDEEELKEHLALIEKLT